MKDQKRNLNPHKPAVAAMWLYGNRYSTYNGGLMDFWDSLCESEKRLCRMLVDNIRQARPEVKAVVKAQDF